MRSTNKCGRILCRHISEIRNDMNLRTDPGGLSFHFRGDYAPSLLTENEKAHDHHVHGLSDRDDRI